MKKITVSLAVSLIFLSIFLLSSIASALNTEIAITPRVGAFQSASYSFTRGDVGVIIQVDSTIAVGETVAIEQLDSDGVTWGSIYIDGTEQILTNDNTQLVINGINKVRFNKSVTAASVGVQIIKE